MRPVRSFSSVLLLYCPSFSRRYFSSSPSSHVLPVHVLQTKQISAVKGSLANECDLVTFSETNYRALVEKNSLKVGEGVLFHPYDIIVPDEHKIYRPAMIKRDKWRTKVAEHTAHTIAKSSLTTANTNTDKSSSSSSSLLSSHSVSRRVTPIVLSSSEVCHGLAIPLRSVSDELQLQTQNDEHAKKNVTRWIDQMTRQCVQWKSSAIKRTYETPLTHSSKRLAEPCDTPKSSDFVDYNEDSEEDCHESSSVRSYPSWLPQSNEMNLLSVPQILSEFSSSSSQGVYLSTKFDGMSATFSIHNNCFTICSRCLRIPDSTSLRALDRSQRSSSLRGVSGDFSNDWIFLKLAEDLQLEKKMKEEKMEEIAIQGEIISSFIQNGVTAKQIAGKIPMAIDDPKAKDEQMWFFVYDVYDIRKKNYLNVEQMLSVCKKLKLLHVPIIYCGAMPKSLDFFTSVVEHSSFQALALPLAKFAMEAFDGQLDSTRLTKYLQQQNKQRSEGVHELAEGVVLRPMRSVYSPTLKKRLSVKILSESYIAASTNR